jgi:hypothetical protein
LTKTTLLLRVERELFCSFVVVWVRFSVAMAAGNEWINGYLEAILDTGERIHDHRHVGVNDFQAAKYFVESVTGFDESFLYRTWIKVRAQSSALCFSIVACA